MPKITEQVGRARSSGSQFIATPYIVPHPYMADLPGGGVSKKMGENLESSQEPQLGLRRLNSQLEAFIEASRNRAVLTACK